MATEDPTSDVMALPTELLECVLSYLDHTDLHASECTSVAAYDLVRGSDLWRQVAKRHMMCVNWHDPTISWAHLARLTTRACRKDAQLLRSIQACSSEDRASESPENTLSFSPCWGELRQLESTAVLTNVRSFVVTLGEHFQANCGCSTGNSCYWSSSASSDKTAVDFIDYQLNGPCVVSCVQIVPYRVFWHPRSPTYAPQQVRVEFFEASDDGTEPEPFYSSPAYDVENDMTLQEFALPVKVLATASTIMRVQVIGRHQEQTFAMPSWMQQTEEDRQPKYYVCLSYVGVLGMPCTTMATASSPMPPESSSPLSALSVFMMPRTKQQELLSPSRMATVITDYMTSCYEIIMDKHRCGQ